MYGSIQNWASPGVNNAGFSCKRLIFPMSIAGIILPDFFVRENPSSGNQIRSSTGFILYISLPIF